MSLKNEDVKVGDLVLLKPGRVLFTRGIPNFNDRQAIVLKINDSGVEGLCEVMCLDDNYVTVAHVEMDIEKVVSLEESGLV